MPSGLAFSTDVYHRNNHKDRNQAMGMERGRMRREPDNQSSGKATAKINRKTAAAASTFRRCDEDPYDSDSDTEHHCYFTFTWTGWERRGDYDKPTPLVQPSVESSSNTSASHYEIMTASRDKDHDVNAGG